MIVNSSELRTTGFDLREVIPLQLESVTRGDRRTRGAALKQIHDMGTRRYVLSVDNDNEKKKIHVSWGKCLGAGFRTPVEGKRGRWGG